MITKNELIKLSEKYETKDFITDDPIQFPYRFKKQYVILSGTKDLTDSSGNALRMTESDIEIAAFIASLFAYGNRKVFIKKLDELFEIMQNKPLDYVLNFNPKSLKGFNYRFAKDFDIIEVFRILNRLYSEGKSLRQLFEHGYNINQTISNSFQAVTDYFYSNVKSEVGQGFYHLIPNPKNGGAMKRMCMLLRWMVRKGPVDLGVWDFIPTSELLIPLDVHVARLSREMGLLNRSSNDFKAVLELTENLKQIDSKDPAKFDFAIFGLGVDK